MFLSEFRASSNSFVSCFLSLTPLTYEKLKTKTKGEGENERHFVFSSLLFFRSTGSSLIVFFMLLIIIIKDMIVSF